MYFHKKTESETHCYDTFIVRFTFLTVQYKNNPVYGRHRIPQRLRIGAPIQNLKNVMFHMSHVTCHLLPTPTATATATDPPPANGTVTQKNSAYGRH